MNEVEPIRDKKRIRKVEKFLAKKKRKRFITFCNGDKHWFKGFRYTCS